MSESIELYSIEWNTEMTKTKFLALFILLPSTYMINLVNGGQFLNTTWMTGATWPVILPLTRMYALL